MKVNVFIFEVAHAGEHDHTIEQGVGECNKTSLISKI